MTTVGAGWRREDRCTPAEKRLVRQVEKGQLADFLGSDAVPGVMGMQAWGPDRTIRAAVIRRLLVDDRPSATAKSVTIRGAKIRGILDLEDAKPRCPLRLDSCYFADSGGLMLDRARIPLLSITRCWLASLSGEGLAVLGTLDLSLDPPRECR